MAISNKINNASIKSLKIDDKRINDTEFSGFHILISPKGKKTYYIYYRINGKQVNYKLGTHPELSPVQARDLAKARLGEVATGIDVQKIKKEIARKSTIAKHSQLETYLDQIYLPFLETRNAKTSKTIITTIKRGFPHLLATQLSDIRAKDIEDWRNKQKKTNKKASTINGYVNYLKGALSRAVERDIIPSHDLSKVKSLKGENKIVRFLSTKEELNLREALTNRNKLIKEQRESGNKHRLERGYSLLPCLKDKNYAGHLQPLVLLAMNTGMRKGEIFGLKWEHVDLINSNLTVISSNAKSGNSRHIPLNNEAKTTLLKWKADTDSIGLVFKGKDGNQITDIKKSWSSLLNDAHITNFRFHDLRHHFASKLVMASVDLNTVRELLGHSDLKMTLRYAHLAPEHKAAAVNLIG